MRVVILAVLIYLGLDFSFASMPGAFVFDAEESLESVQRSRVHDVDMSAQALIHDPRDVVEMQQDAAKLPVVDVRVSATAWIPIRPGAERTRAVPESAPLSEDPH